MESNKLASKEEYVAKKKEFEALVHPIMAKMQKGIQGGFQESIKYY
ncbi:Cytosolic_heat shock protein 70 [Hexamita inflata]|uniref:Cytosolic heat shock protein 70 n=1 Tax=Hexamita inflata TaxID=28002 RepID=A0AA86UPE3_9EUKA|nr:Cytosolic heat shock protein 70 [Hexamita inflata]